VNVTARLPLFKDQVEDVHHGPQAPPMAHVIPERRAPKPGALDDVAGTPNEGVVFVTDSPHQLPTYKDQTREVHDGPQDPDMIIKSPPDP